jgi:cytochrome bd-type quinol oxidase subunit 2
MSRTLYLDIMMTRTQDDEQSRLDRAARRAVLVEGLPVVALGAVALALGSAPADTGRGDAGWAAVSMAFVLAVAWVLVRAFRRADEYQRKIQLESMAVAFAAVLVALQGAMLLDAVGVGNLRQSAQLVVIGGVLLWLLVADLRTRLHR